jgi:hypothetical protein
MDRLTIATDVLPSILHDHIGHNYMLAESSDSISEVVKSDYKSDYVYKDNSDLLKDEYTKLPPMNISKFMNLYKKYRLNEDKINNLKNYTIILDGSEGGCSIDMLLTLEQFQLIENISNQFKRVANNSLTPSIVIYEITSHKGE